MADDNHIDMALRDGVQDILGMFEERTELNKRIGEKYAELKEAGFNITIVRQMVREQRMEPEARNAKYQLEQEYRDTLGLFGDTPLGEATMQREASMPRPFAEQPVHEPLPVRRGRGRPRKDVWAETFNDLPAE